MDGCSPQVTEKLQEFEGAQDLSIEAICNSLSEFDQELLQNDTECNWDLSGTTCCLVYLKPEMVYCVNVGDSRAIYCSETADGKV